MLTRREFLALCGITVIGSQVAGILLDDWFQDTPQFGRALRTANVRAAADPYARIVNRLWADSTTKIHSQHGTWLRVGDGYVAQEDLQLIEPYHPAVIVSTPSWVEVAAPVAVVRQWCATDAPLIARIGHGGVLRAVDRLDDWYAIEDAQGRLLGWSQTVHWREAHYESQRGLSHWMSIDLQQHTLTAYDHDHAVVNSSIAVNPTLRRGEYVIQHQQHGGFTSDGHQGIGWHQVFGNDFSLAGVYWHNRFGSPSTASGIQTTTMMARWLFGWLAVGSRVVVI